MKNILKESSKKLNCIIYLLKKIWSDKETGQNQAPEAKYIGHNLSAKNGHFIKMIMKIIN